MVKDLVSIVIPTFNRADLLPRAIQSVKQQSYTNWELIIVDDRSEDNTAQLIDRYIQEDQRIKYITNLRSKGAAGARNMGILHASGEYIAFLDSDDEWFDYHLTDSLKALNESEANVSFSLWVEKAEGKTHNPFMSQEIRNNIEGKKERFQANGNVILFEDGLFEHFLEDAGWFYHINTIVLRKKVIEKFGLFNEKYAIGEDTEFLVRFFSNTRIVLIDNVHFVYHQSPNSLYFFCNRGEIEQDTIWKDKEMVRKLTYAGVSSNKVRFIIRSRARRTSSVKKNRILLGNLDSAISRKYFTLSYINIGHRLKSAYFCVLSLRYEFTREKFMFLMKLMFPFISISKYKYDIDLY